MLKIEVIPVSLFMQNSSLIWDDETKEAIIVDAGDEAQKLISYVEERNLKPVYLINTHCHIDHVGAVAELKEYFGIPFYCHKDEDFWLEQLEFQASRFGFSKAPETPEVDQFIDDRSVLTVGKYRFEVIHTPGHTPGGCCFYFETEKLLIAGDTLFAGSIGRTDFPRGSFDDLSSAIKTKLFILDPETVVYPGHGPTTTIGEERDTNPFVGQYS